MKKKWLLLILSCAVFCELNAERAFRRESIIFLQPNSVLEERCPSVQDLVAYIKTIESMAESVLVQEKAYPSSGFLVIAVRPEKRLNIWLDFSPELPKDMGQKLRKAILALSPCPIKSGIVVFALKSSLWEAPITKENFPQPAEWLSIVESKQDPVDIDTLLDELWTAQ